MTQLGYRVWLDIFHMGGGDSLLKKTAPNVHTNKPRHLLEMQRPTSASRNNNDNIEQ